MALLKAPTVSGSAADKDTIRFIVDAAIVHLGGNHLSGGRPLPAVLVGNAPIEGRERQNHRIRNESPHGLSLSKHLPEMIGSQVRSRVN